VVVVVVVVVAHICPLSSADVKLEKISHSAWIVPQV